MAGQILEEKGYQNHEKQPRRKNNEYDTRKRKFKFKIHMKEVKLSEPVVKNYSLVSDSMPYFSVLFCISSGNKNLHHFQFKQTELVRGT
jgi:hypothetical protein